MKKKLLFALCLVATCFSIFSPALAVSNLYYEYYSDGTYNTLVGERSLRFCPTHHWGTTSAYRLIEECS